MNTPTGPNNDEIFWLSLFLMNCAITVVMALDDNPSFLFSAAFMVYCYIWMMKSKNE